MYSDQGRHIKDIMDRLSSLDESELNEANPDGTVSDDEDDREDQLANEVSETMDELLNKIQNESEDIGGPFRAPGIKSRIYRMLKDKLEKGLK